MDLLLAAAAVAADLELLGLAWEAEAHLDLLEHWTMKPLRLQVMEIWRMKM